MSTKLQLRPYQHDLIAETRTAFCRGYKRPLIVLPCGAGKTVCFAYMADAHVRKKKNNCVWFLVHRKELLDQTLDTFKKFKISLDDIYIGMVSSIRETRTPTMIIFDEAHHASASTWERIINKYPNIPIIGLTATPCRLTGAPLGKIFDCLITGVKSEWLIENKFLSEYDYFAPQIFKLPDDIKIRTGDYDLAEVADFLDKSRIYGDILKYIDLNRKTLIYAPTVAYSKRLASAIKGAVHFDGTTPKKERDLIIEKFRKGEIRVLLNVNLIGEGFDVPDCDCVILLRPTRSAALYIQQAMRCLRPNEKKRAVIYDLVGNAYRHGLPTDDHAWSLNKPIKIRNSSSEPDILCRRCASCQRVYKGISRTCPYCEADNGKTRAEIANEREVELVKINKIKKIEQSSAYTFDDLVALGRKRGYNNPQFWARMIMKGRGKNY